AFEDEAVRAIDIIGRLTGENPVPKDCNIPLKEADPTPIPDMPVLPENIRQEKPPLIQSSGRLFRGFLFFLLFAGIVLFGTWKIRRQTVAWKEPLGTGLGIGGNKLLSLKTQPLKSGEAEIKESYATAPLIVKVPTLIPESTDSESTVELRLAGETFLDRLRSGEVRFFSDDTGISFEISAADLTAGGTCEVLEQIELFRSGQAGWSLFLAGSAFRTSIYSLEWRCKSAEWFPAGQPLAVYHFMHFGE
ncbi:MAG: hypothetical protein PHQ23_05225, partial [Candidatus Wallbacteria bacterium]|nr:hypothetical protein [Candidatus Wallbacteria bacterium]